MPFVDVTVKICTSEDQRNYNGGRNTQAQLA